MSLLWSAWGCLAQAPTGDPPANGQPTGGSRGAGRTSLPGNCHEFTNNSQEVQEHTGPSRAGTKTTLDLVLHPILVKGTNKHLLFCGLTQSKFISHPDNSLTQGLPVGGRLSSHGCSISWQRGQNTVVKAYLILKNLSPAVTHLTSTHVPVASLSAPPPSVSSSRLTQFPGVAAGASQETRRSQETTPSPAPGGTSPLPESLAPRVKRL